MNNFKYFKNLLFSCILLITFSQCDADTEDSANNETSIESFKINPNDPFINSITASQFFDLDGNKDHIIEGENGTLIVAPQGCFLNAQGIPVTEDIKIELKESLTIEEMVLSNLTTTADGDLLETGGMIYINATANGEQLHIDESNPLYIEIPTNDVKEGMMAYKGIRDEAGNMNWIEPKKLDNFLVSIDMNLLDFLPNGFAEAVNEGMPFKNHKTANKTLIDSLYYSLSVSNGSSHTQGFHGTDYNEPYDLENKVVDGQYTTDSYNTNSKYYDVEVESVADSLNVEKESNCGVDPAKIKVLKSPKFENTLIATREFELRLKTIFKTCDPDIIDLYSKNLEKDLFEIDKIAAKQLKGTEFHDAFVAFAARGETNVKGGKKYAATLKQYYETELKAIKKELEKANNELVAVLKSKNEIAKEKATEYRELLWKRENFRMKKYGFQWSNTGWINVDRGTSPKEWGRQRFEVIANNGKTLDRIYTYVVYTSIKSLYRMNTNDGELFYVGNETMRSMLMPKKERAVAIAIGYIGDEPFLGMGEFTTGDSSLSLTLNKSSLEGIKKAIKPYDNYQQENKIGVDLAYMDFFAKERKRQQKLYEEANFIHSLWNIARPCCVMDAYAVEEVIPTMH